MLRLSIQRVKPEKEERLRAWLSELNARADEVRATFADETVRHEQAYIIATSDGPIMVYAMEAADFEIGRAAFASSTHPIDAEHRSVMRDCLGEKLLLEPAYDVEAKQRPAEDA
jgi:hypothetical protein